MPAPALLVEALSRVPDQLDRAFRLLSRERWHWRPESFAGSPGEPFTAIEHLCHMRDIEIDGYHERIRRVLDETNPVLEPLDGHALAVSRDYGSADADDVLAAFRSARLRTVSMIASLNDEQLSRRGSLADYGPLTLTALLHYLSSHDHQHLACLQWLVGRIASEACGPGAR